VYQRRCPREECGRGVKLTTHIHLMSSSVTSGALSPITHVSLWPEHGKR
jgi:hypothetical protein